MEIEPIRIVEHGYKVIRFLSTHPKIMDWFAGRHEEWDLLTRVSRAEFGDLLRSVREHAELAAFLGVERKHYRSLAHKLLCLAGLKPDEIAELSSLPWEALIFRKSRGRRMAVSYLLSSSPPFATGAGAGPPPPHPTDSGGSDGR